MLRCQSPRMVWTQDRLHDRQRVVHWDLSGSKAGGPARRLVDMYSTGEQRVGEQRLGEQRVGEQRVYEPRDRGRLLLPPSDAAASEAPWAWSSLAHRESRKPAPLPTAPSGFC